MALKFGGNKPKASAPAPGVPGWLTNWIQKQAKTVNTWTQNTRAAQAQTPPLGMSRAQLASMRQGYANTRNPPNNVRRNPQQTALKKTSSPSPEPGNSWTSQDQAMYAQSMAAGGATNFSNPTQYLPREWQTGKAGPNWTRGTYNPPPSWRGENANVTMNQQEYMQRRNAWQAAYQPGWNERIQAAADTPNQPHWIGSEWANANPQPAGFLQTEQERILRQNAAPTGYTYVPYGSSYVKNPSLPSLGDGGNKSGGGGYGGGGWQDWGGGGGGGGGYGGNDYQEVGRWYNSMLQWNINKPNPG